MVGISFVKLLSDEYQVLDHEDLTDDKLTLI